MTKVRKAVIPAAGLGTRFLPATKSQPKEMVPVIDKPTIQYVVEEAVGAGITDILVITGRGKRAIEDHFDRIRSIVEKPKPEDAPSHLAVIGRYVFTPEIFDALDRITPGTGGELQLTDAISLLLETQTVFGYTFESGRYDIGKKIDFLRATVELSLDRPDLGDEFKAFLADLVQRRKIL